MTEAPRALNRDEQTLVERHLSLVEPIARAFAARIGGRHWEDLVSAGRIGLIEAAMRFDRSEGLTFAEYAPFRIRGAMADAARRERREAERVVLTARMSGYDTVSRHRRAGNPLMDGDEEVRSHIDDRADFTHGSMFAAVVGAIIRGQGEDAVVLREEYSLAIGSLQEELKRFRDEERWLIHLRYFEEATWEQIAARLGGSARSLRYAHDDVVMRLGRQLRARGVAMAPPVEGR